MEARPSLLGAGFAGGQWTVLLDLPSARQASSGRSHVSVTTVIPEGLSESEVLARRSAGQGNIVPSGTGRSYGRIVQIGRAHV